MTSATRKFRTDTVSPNDIDPLDDNVDVNALDDVLDDVEGASPPDELEEETGIDLTDASDLDADNVTADEEGARVVQAPD